MRKWHDEVRAVILITSIARQAVERSATADSELRDVGRGCWCGKEHWPSPQRGCNNSGGSANNA
jgi:hypothetical protein